MPDPLDTRLVLAIFIGEKDAITSLQFAFLDEFSLFDLCARGDVEYFSCALVEDILYKRRAVEFMHGEIRQHIPFAVV